MLLRALRASAAVLLAVAAACSGDSTSSRTGLRGTWTMQTIDGHSLPFQWNANKQMTASTLTFANDSQFVFTSSWHEPGAEHPDYTDRMAGRYQRAGSTLDMQFGNSLFGRHAATLSGRALTLHLGDDDDPDDWVYQR